MKALEYLLVLECGSLVPLQAADAAKWVAAVLALPSFTVTAAKKAGAKPKV